MSRMETTPAGRASFSLEHWLPLVLLVGFLAFGFQGSRSIWEPDEGFYVNVSLGMLNTGDWVIPRLNSQPFLDKPPLLYWGSALGMGILGKNEWGARVPHAIWFCGTVLLVGLLGRHLLGKGKGRLAALVYGTSLLPFIGANALTPDTVLAFCSALALLCYCRALSDSEGAKWRLVWWLAFGAATGLGALAKGPAVFIFVFPSAIHYLWMKGPRRALLDPLPYVGVLVAGAIVLPWYGAVISRLPGAASYFIDNQVTGRLLTALLFRLRGWFMLCVF
jgi:4-amino-4-deoxy-L-arabinose transferase-like glycosyltransferase